MSATSKVTSHKPGAIWDYFNEDEMNRQQRRAEIRAIVSDPMLVPDDDALAHADSMPTYEEAPVFGLNGGEHGKHSVPEYVEWFSDGEDSRYENN